jgi:small subunit ribosomal protein S2
MDLKKLIEAGVPFGHPTSSWSPKMAPFIWGAKNKVYLIDVAKTARQMEVAAQFLEGVAAAKKTILVVGTKKAAREAVRTMAQNLNLPFVANRWIGGTLTNYTQVKKLVTKYLHTVDILEKADQTIYTKQELNRLQKMVDKLSVNISGIIGLRWPIGALVIVDVKKEQAALKEAVALGIPVVAIVDTNSDPSLVDYVIPANDDAPKSIQLILNYLAEGIARGKEAAVATQAAAAVEEQEMVPVNTTVELALAALDVDSDTEEPAATAGKKPARSKPVRSEPRKRPAGK